eukprot:TRINITY_DN25521_c0_g1_i1.p1 TRINITY_DN25521_c0_g1~~TRINITY_DN25521_c0_g1_i1.p1  ORF type:complete len:934 (+),score=273.69 TRINITY_DN25521_c0_g1_i1:90-2891(+)
MAAARSKGDGNTMRQTEIFFLQEQNKQVLETLERVEAERENAHEQISACEERDSSLQTELQTVHDKIGVLANRLKQDKTETAAKDEHVRVLSEQNKQMLGMLETEENKSKKCAETIRELESKNRKLLKISEEFDVAKAELEKQVAEAKSKCSDVVARVKSARNLNETLRSNVQNTEARTRVDIEALGQALQVVNQKNLEYMAKIGKQEVREQQLKAETATLQEEVEAVRAEIDALRKQLEGDDEGRSVFERVRSQMELAIDALEVQVDTLKKALSTAERANEQLQDENRTTADRCRETADKVYALMDSLRLNQVELKKQEAENNSRDKKLLSLERQTQNLQAKITMETDAKVLAEQERKEAEQEAVVLKKKNKKIEENVTASQAAQEKAEKAISEMNDKVSNLQTQNAYLASRIDGQEEEKSALKVEIKKISDKTTQLSKENSTLRDSIEVFEEQVATTISDTEAFKKELEYIKREDVLDDAGRQRPILIQSTESDLLEKLQVNEFLYEAQQARNPVPPMIEKVAQLLAMLHEGQQRSDAYLADLSKSNGLVSALRERNMTLFARTQMFESFKTRALLRYVMNMIEGERFSSLHLDGLSFGPREINETLQLFQRYECTEKVYVMSFIDNGLDDDSINLILQMIYALPYLRSLDIKKNCFSDAGLKKIEDQLRAMEGITAVIKTDDVYRLHSGNQLRMTVDVSDQMAKEHVAKEIDFTVDQSMQATDVDPFLNSSAATSSHPWTKTPAAHAAQRPPQKAMPDASAVKLDSPTTGVPAAPAVGGPPVGLGGPGNLAALNKKAGAKGGKDKLPDPKKRAAGRKKAAPPPSLEYQPVDRPFNDRVVDKWQAGNSTPMSMVQMQAQLAQTLNTYSNSRPSSAMRRSASSRSELSRASDEAPVSFMSSGDSVRKSMERSSSTPHVTRSVRKLPPHGYRG